MSRAVKPTPMAGLTKSRRMPIAFTSDQVASLLGLTRSRVRSLVAEWKIRSVLYKGRRYVTRAEVMRVFGIR